MAILRPLLPRAAQAMLGDIGAPTNELGDPLGRTNELGDALPALDPIAQSPTAIDPNVARTNMLQDDLARRSAPPTPPTTTLGKIGHVAANVGNVLGDIFAPDTMALIPGTQLHNERIMARDKADLEKTSQLQTEEAKTNAAQLIEITPETAASIGNPSLAGEQVTQGAFQHLLTNAGTNTMRVTTNANTNDTKESIEEQKLQARAAEIANGKIGDFQHVAGTSGGKQVFANYNPAKGEVTDLNGKVLTDFTPANKAMQGALGGFGPAFAASRMMLAAYNENPALLQYMGPLMAKMLGANTPGAVQAFSSVPNGQPQDANGNPIGLRMPGAPTGVTRSRGQFAESVLPSVDDAKAEIMKLGDQLGPMAGRWNDLATSKVGAYGPQFSGLQTQLKNVSTAWMRLHANSETAREDFAKMLSASQDPANLVANLDALEGQAKDYVQEGKGQPGTLGGKTPQGSGAAPKEGDTKTNAAGDKVKFSGGKWGPANGQH
jgi:hypothetical protein